MVEGWVRLMFCLMFCFPAASQQRILFVFAFLVHSF